MTHNHDHEDIQTTLRHYARFLPRVDQRNVAFLDAFAAEPATDGLTTDPGVQEDLS